MTPYGRQLIDEEDIQSVLDVLRSDRLTQGPIPGLFEQALCEYTGAAYASVCANGTAALHLAMLALGVSAGDKVWTSSLSFVASANAALYCGAEIDFVDIDPASFNMSVCSLEQKLQAASLTDTLPKVLVVVHMAGNPVRLQEIQRLKAKYGFAIIEDACHALGASYQGDKVGSCRYSDLCVFSFHPVKSITSGEGGAVMSNDESLIRRVRLYCSHGISRDRLSFETENPAPWFYEQQVLGFNYRLSDIHAALGLSQLKKLEQYLQKRRQLVSHYKQALSGLPLSFQQIDPDGESAYHLMVILLPLADDDTLKRRLYDFLGQEKIGAQVHYIPIHRQPYYRQLYPQMQWHLPETDKYYQRALSIPLFPAMTQADAARAANSLCRFFGDEIAGGFAAKV
jgi:UDP-4-amino-4,6-dideoxy-N-acetyl-beta-L-altrosamine transaminase